MGNSISLAGSNSRNDNHEKNGAGMFLALRSIRGGYRYDGHSAFNTVYISIVRRSTYLPTSFQLRLKTSEFNSERVF